MKKLARLLFFIIVFDTIIRQGVSLHQTTMNSSKTMYLIRHAESNENTLYNAARRVWARLAACSLPVASDVQTGMSLPFLMFQSQVMDADVSDFGQLQIQSLRRNFLDDDFEFVLEGASEKGHLAVAHSPLKRAKQTAHGIINGVLYQQAEKEGVTESSSFVDFQELECLREINPKEMFRHGNKQLDKRISVFEKWIESRPETHIAVIGHSVYFKRMLRLSRPFDNCDVWELQYTPNITHKDKSIIDGKDRDADDHHVPPRSWHSMRLLYRQESSSSKNILS